MGRDDWAGHSRALGWHEGRWNLPSIAYLLGIIIIETSLRVEYADSEHQPKPESVRDL